MAGLKARIVEKSSDLNPSDKKILNYLLNNAAECSELSLAKLAKKLYVSESAIFRLCKKIGLSGYSELKYELADFSKGEKRMVKQQDTFAERLVKNLRSELSYFRTLDFESFYSTLNQTENIYIYTTGWQQASIASYLSNQLLVNVGKPTVVMPSAISELKMSKNWLQDHDQLIVISFSGEDLDLCQLLDELHLLNEHLTITSLTTIKESRLASLSDYSLFFQPSLFHESISTKNWAFSPAYIMIDLLINGYCEWLRKEDE